MVDFALRRYGIAEAKDGNPKTVYRLDEARDRWVKNLVIDNGRVLKELVHRRVVKQVIGDTLHWQSL